MLVDHGEMGGSAGSKTSMNDLAAGSYHHPCDFHLSVGVMKCNFGTKVCPGGDIASLDHSGSNLRTLCGSNCLSYMVDLPYTKFHLKQFSSKICATGN